MSRQADTLIVVHNHIYCHVNNVQIHSLAQAVLRGYHQLPSFSLTTLTNLVINLSLSLLSPSLYSPFKNGVISSGLHLARVRNKSANRIAGCKGRVWSGKGVIVGEEDVNFSVPSGAVKRCSPYLSAGLLLSKGMTYL
jgi:hypothetical protein